tara:strand:- start:27211 stop:28434 length:1224 start_codon:yes stop_codon:yes gene_type:complete
MNCRFCKKELKTTFLDLGYAPPTNAFRSNLDLKKPEVNYPLKIMVCKSCWLVQTVDYVDADMLFNPDYAYFSSTSSSWLKHCQKFVEGISKQLVLNKSSFVIEVASNDGYLLNYFKKLDIPCLGIEPTKSTAEASKKLGIEVIQEFFGESVGRRLVSEGKKADLIIGNNVFAHVPDINDFTRGLGHALKSNGTISIEFAYLLELIKNNEFDTVYHEHFSYLSLHAVKLIFENSNLRIYDAIELPTHGGSLRVLGCKKNAKIKTSKRVIEQLKKEREAGLLEPEVYKNFQFKVEVIKNNFLSFLLELKSKNSLVVGYGAAAKGNTFINYAGIKSDLISFVCDAAPSKQGKFLPGSQIPVYHPDFIKKHKPDYIVILPWNISDEIIMQLSYVREWGCKFITAVPKISIL